MKKDKKTTTKNLDSTGHKRAEETLRRLATVVRDSNDAIIIQDIDGRITAWNRGAELMYGYSEAEALGMNIERLSPPDKAAEQKEFTRRLIMGEAVTSFETQRVTKDGRILDVWLTVTKLVEDSADIVVSTGRDISRPIGIALIERNITERKRLEKFLLESEKKFRTLFEDSIDAVIISTVEGRILDCNDSMLNLTGYKKEELLDANAVKLYANPTDREVFAREIQKTGSVKEYEVKWIKKDGTAIDVVMTLTARRDEDGNIIGEQGIVRDITERKRAQEALQKALNEVRTLRGIVPICAHCKKIRDDQGYWNQVETYVRDHTEAEFSHGICPECMKKMYTELEQDDRNAPKNKGGPQ